MRAQKTESLSELALGPRTPAWALRGAVATLVPAGKDPPQHSRGSGWLGSRARGPGSPGHDRPEVATAHLALEAPLAAGLARGCERTRGSCRHFPPCLSMPACPGSRGLSNPVAAIRGVWGEARPSVVGAPTCLDPSPPQRRPLVPLVPRGNSNPKGKCVLSGPQFVCLGNGPEQWS